MHDEIKSDVAQRLERSKASFSDKMAELGRRVDALHDRTHRIKEVATRPAVMFGVAAALGLWLGVRGRSQPITVAATDGVVRVSPTHPGLLRMALREVVLVSASVWTRKYLEKRLSGA